jgi:hypothetical protein
MHESLFTAALTLTDECSTNKAEQDKETCHGYYNLSGFLRNPKSFETNLFSLLNPVLLGLRRHSKTDQPYLLSILSQIIN